MIKVKFCSLFFGISLIVFINFNSCAQPAKGTEEMKKTVGRLMLALKSCDSAIIIGMIVNEKEKKEEINSFRKECDLYAQIINKYGIPNKNRMVVSESYRQNIEIRINLMNQIDSALNIKKCDLVVQFYNREFYNPNKIISFTLDRDRLFVKRNILPPGIPPIK